MKPLITSIVLGLALCMTLQTNAQLPYYSISQINSVDTNGDADSIGVNCRINGIVHCIDFRVGSGLEFHLIEYNNVGIRVFDFNDVSNYTVTAGDSIEVWGAVTQFNGQLQFNPDSIVVRSTANPLVAPQVVTQLSEATENKAIVFQNAYLVDPAQWINTGSGFNVDMTNGTDTISVRINNATNLYGTNAPTGTFDISGIGVQYDPTFPRTEGYQLAPCGLSSINYATPPPYYSISQIDGVNANGEADSAGVNCQISGIVHCIDFRAGTGLEFFLAEYNNVGIRVFDFNDVSNYTVTEGDSIEVWGYVTQYNGHLQFNPDSIALRSTGNTTLMPMTVTQLSEATENKFILFQNAHLVDTTQWDNSAGGFNVDITNGTDTIVARIDNATDLYGTAAPLGTFDISGWGAQFDFSSPFTEYYQMYPCGLHSITTITNQSSIANTSEGEVTIFPNPSEGNVFVDLNLKETKEVSINIMDMTGRIVMTSLLGNTQTDKVELPTTILPAGMYIIQTKIDSKQITKKLILK